MDAYYWAKYRTEIFSQEL